MSSLNEFIQNGRNDIYWREVMKDLITIASLLVFAWVNYRLGFNKGYLEGFEKGANRILDEWREWINNMEENENERWKINRPGQPKR